jgi:hypothetical protein
MKTVVKFRVLCKVRNLLIELDSTFCGATAPSGPGSPHYRYFTITLKHTTLGRAPVDE